MPTPTPGTIEEDEQNLILPKEFTDEDMEALLSQVLDSPDLIGSNAMVTVLDNPMLTQNQSIFSTGSEVGNFFEGLSVENPVAIDKVRQGSIEISEAESPGNAAGDMSDLDPGEDIDQAILQYELAQDEQLLRMMAEFKPLDKIIGFKPGEICTACFHVGHYITDINVCPTAHIRSLFSEKPFYDRLPNRKQARRLLMADIGYACQGLSWAIKYICQGYMQQVGIFPGTVEELHNLLKKWKSVSTDENFTFGKFGTLGGELMFGEPINIPLIINTQGLYQQIFVQGNPETDDHSPDLLKPISPIPGEDVQYDRGQRPECDADRLKLEIIGGRPATICTNCFYRGHTRSSVKLCPYRILLQAVERARNAKRKRKLDNVSREVERLQKVVDGIEHSEDNDVMRIAELLEEWQEIVTNSSITGAKSSAVPPRQLQDRIPNTPAGLQVPKPAGIRTNNLLQDLYNNNQPGSLNNSSATTLQNAAYNSNFLDPSSLSSRNFTPALNSPFDDDDESALYNFPSIDNRFSFPQESDGFDPDLQFLSTGGMSGYFNQELDTSILTGPQQSLTKLTPQFSPNDTGERITAFQYQAQEDTAGCLEVPMSRSPSPCTVISQQGTNTLHDASKSNSNETPANYELPAMIFWRSRCPLKVIGNRTDNLCKSCLHYGHDKRNSACPVNIVREAIATEELHEVLEIESSIQELEAAVKWQGSIPPNIRGDTSLIQHLVRKWKKLVETLKKAENYSDIDMDTPGSKHQCPPGGKSSYPPFYQQQSENRAASMQMDCEVQQFAPSFHHSTEGGFNQTLHLDPPHQFPASSNQHDKLYSPQESFITQSTDDAQAYLGQIISTQSSGQLPLEHQQPVAALRGIAVDYARMDPDLFVRISRYIIKDNNQGLNGNLRVDFQKMPKELIVDISQYFLSDLQQPPAQQENNQRQDQHQHQHQHQQHQHQHQQQQYQGRLETPKRKRG